MRGKSDNELNNTVSVYYELWYCSSVVTFTASVLLLQSELEQKSGVPLEL